MQPFRTGDGSLSAWHPRYREAYHSRSGARTQARRLYLEGSGSARHPAPRVLELGFGLGVNFAVTLENARARGAFLDYRAIEAEPVAPELLEAVLGPVCPDVYARLAGRWGRSLVVTGGGYRLRIDVGRVGDWRGPERWASAVYFDPFSPRVNPEAWREEVFAEIYRALEPGGVLVTYSVAGRVRRGLAAAGFAVERIPGWGGKGAWLRALRGSPEAESVEAGDQQIGQGAEEERSPGAP